MTAAFASDQRQENRAEQLESLRRQMAGVSGKMSGKAVTRSDDLLPESDPSWRPLARVAACAYPGERWRCCREPGHCC